MGCARPVRRFYAPRALSECAFPRPKPWAALHGLPLLFRARSPGPRAVPPVTRQVGRHFLSWTSVALRHSSRPADPFADGGSLRHRVPRAGFGYPLRDVHRRPCRCDKRIGASLGFTLQGFPLVTIGAPLGARALLPLPGHLRLPGGQRGRPWPASGPCSRDESVLTPEPPKWSRPSIPSWGSPLQSVLPFDLALALIAAPPPSSSGGLTFRPARTPGYHSSNEWDGPSPDHQLS
jgi:hypothetical protein